VTATPRRYTPTPSYNYYSDPYPRYFNNYNSGYNNNNNNNNGGGYSGPVASSPAPKASDENQKGDEDLAQDSPKKKFARFRRKIQERAKKFFSKFPKAASFPKAAPSPSF